jgi:hypothetical protein
MRRPVDEAIRFSGAVLAVFHRVRKLRNSMVDTSPAGSYISLIGVAAALA